MGAGFNSPVTNHIDVGFPLLYAFLSAKGASSPREGPCPPYLLLQSGESSFSLSDADVPGAI